MDELLIYQAKVAVIIVVFYLFYRVIARKETYHHLNRIILILSTLLSFILPLCVITITQIVISKATQSNQSLYINQLNNQLAEQKIDWILALGALYIIGASIVVSYMIISYIKLKRLINGCKLTEHSATARIYTTSQNITPCSWFSNIIISESDLNNDPEIIIAHEKAHVKLNHSLDIALINLCCTVQWFNPAMWLVRTTLKEIHEYQADSSVISQGFNAKNYQLLLIKKVVGSESYSIANNLNHSSLKNRITMMLSRKSSVASRLKLLYVVPLIGISLTAFAQTKIVTEDLSNKGNKNSITTKPIAKAEITYYISETKEQGKKSSEATDTTKRSTVNLKSEIQQQNSSTDKPLTLTIYINDNTAFDTKKFHDSIERLISDAMTKNGTNVTVPINISLRDTSGTALSIDTTITPHVTIVSDKSTDITITKIKDILRKFGIKKVIYTNKE